jgi:hypothetical protein
MFAMSSEEAIIGPIPSMRRVMIEQTIIQVFD